MIGAARKSARTTVAQRLATGGLRKWVAQSRPKSPNATGAVRGAVPRRFGSAYRAGGTGDAARFEISVRDCGDGWCLLKATAAQRCQCQGLRRGWLQSAKTSRESWTKNVWSWPLAVSVLLYLAFGLPSGTRSSA